MRYNLLTLFFAFVFIQLNAQNTINSPFSSFGFGEKGGIDNPVFTGLGNSSITYFDSTLVNFYNPASYNTLGLGQPLFSIGISSRLSFYEQNSVSLFKSAVFVEHFAMAFTLKKHFGLAFGLKPFSRKGYEMYERVAAGSDSLLYSYLGSGGSSEVFLGLSSNIVKFKNTTLSVGANIGYLFGSSTNERRSQLIGSSTGHGGVEWKSIRMNSLHYEIGTYFKHTFKENHDIKLAIVMEPGQSLNGSLDEYLFQGLVGNPNTYDTLYVSENQKGQIQLAPTLTLGINYNYRFKDAKKNNNERNSEIGFHFNYSLTDWTRFSSSFNPSANLLATNKLTIGIQYIPEHNFYLPSTNTNFFEKARYRVGYYQYTLPYSLEGEQLQDFGTTFGLGLPIFGQNSLSSVNLGVSFGKRQTSAPNSLNEKYVGINFGVTLAPSNFDRWFKKRKLD